MESILRPSVRMMQVALGSRSCHRQRSSFFLGLGLELGLGIGL